MIIMFERYLADSAVIGSTFVTARDGSGLLMYSTYEGKHFLRSWDHFRTVDETWLTAVGTMTANANLIRLKDGKLMMPVKLPSPIERVSKLGGADFAVLFSDDDGHTFHRPVRVNPVSGCYYVMNQRLMRTHTGRILLPISQVPDELLNNTLESAGKAGCYYSDDEGQSWQESAWVKGESVDQLAEPIVVQGKGTRLHMYMRTGVGYLYHSVSDDDGVHWSREQPTVLRSPCAPFNVQYDTFDDRFLAVWDNSFPGTVHQYPRSPICLAESRDGESWHMLCELDANPSHGYGYPMIVPFKDEILITYYESPQRAFDSRSHRLKMKLLSREECKMK